MCYRTMWRYMVARCGTPIIHSWIESPDANGMTRFGTTFSSIDCSGRCFNCSGFKIIVVIVIVVIIRCKSGIIAVMCNSVKVRIRDGCNFGVITDWFMRNQELELYWVWTWIKGFFACKPDQSNKTYQMFYICGSKMFANFGICSIRGNYARSAL